MDLSVIIVSWNVKNKLKENLTALLKSRTDFSFEVLVADNASWDASAEMVENDFPRIKLIKNSANLGFARANNLAFAEAQGEFILLLNPDMRVNPETIDNIVRWAKENKQAGVIGCRLTDEQERNVPHVRRFPDFFDQLAIILKLPHLWPKILDSYLLPDFNYFQAAAVDSVRGGFFLIRRKAFADFFPKDRVDNNKLLDERFFIWFEEVDFCRELKRLGGEVWYSPAAVCIDYVGQSFKQVGVLKKQKYFRDSMLKYFKKWHKPWKARALAFAWPIGILIALLAEKMAARKKKN